MQENRISGSVSIFESGGDQNACNTGVKYLKEKYKPSRSKSVGGEALWLPKMNQISVHGNEHVHHLAVEYPDGDDKNLEYVKKLAQGIL